ncbi:hypothetical protein K474DRAFT_1584468, partial [Panus rudis PR-1116 ss-1]
FRCDDPDFFVHSIPDGTVFQVRRASLESGSNVFRDMFECCDSGFVMDEVEVEARAIHVPKSSSNLNLLFHLLHAPPPPYVEELGGPVQQIGDSESHLTEWHIATLAPKTAIPLPLLPKLLMLSDKYALSEDTIASLHSHLAAYAPVYPLRVYGYAVELGLETLASRTSMYLLHPPLAQYTPKEVDAIPTAEAYHKLVLLHHYRIERLREVLQKEEIFPHGYRLCVKHAQSTECMWQQRKADILIRIEAATDVAAEMDVLQKKLIHCETCTRAYVAAVSMLAYKCAKIPRETD